MTWRSSKTSSLKATMSLSQPSKLVEGRPSRAAVKVVLGDPPATSAASDDLIYSSSLGKRLQLLDQAEPVLETASDRFPPLHHHNVAGDYADPTDVIRPMTKVRHSTGQHNTTFDRRYSTEDKSTRFDRSAKYDFRPYDIRPKTKVRDSTDQQNTTFDRTTFDR
jgi:hypothetical protein